MAQSPAIGPGKSTHATQAPIESIHALAKLIVNIVMAKPMLFCKAKALPTE